MSDRGWHIRAARDEDAARLSELAERTFREAFAATNTAHDMDLYCAQAFSPAIQASEIENPDNETLVVTHGQDLIAYAQLQRSTPPPCVSGALPIELKRFYVAQPWHGTGVSSALMNAAIEQAAGTGAGVVWLGVWERNPRAIRFYAKCGFAEVGEHVFVVGTDEQRDVVMMRTLR